MNKNKIIFLVIWIIFIILIVSIVFILNFKSTKKTNTWKWNLSIWIIWDDKVKFNEVLKDFKEKFPKYKNNNFDIVSFSSYEDYYNSLIWAFLIWKTPDIFSLNNNDSNFFDLQVLWIDPNVINPDDFRKNYDSVFSNDLIRKTKIDNKDIEFLAWIPLWYETLWLFYNFRKIKWKKLTTWSHINDVIRQISQEDWWIWIWIWNWTTVYWIEDIITQFLLLDWINKLSDANWDKLKTSLSNYIRFGDKNMENKYNSLYEEMIWTNKNNINLFSEWKVQIILWYPRILEQINKNWYDKSFLRADVFPTYIENKWKLLVNYNYLVINKNTKFLELSLDLMKYFASVDWQKKYLEEFAYYMPSMLSLMNERLEENLKDWYTLKYKNFYNKDLELTSFNKWIRAIYDREVLSILDPWVNNVDLFDILRKRLLCISNKMITWELLENLCK